MGVLADKMPTAEKLATEALKGRNFDVEAFLVLSAVEYLKSIRFDRVPESGIDEGINKLMDLFVDYMHERTRGNLMRLLAQAGQILTEIYETLETRDEIEIFNGFIDDLQTIRQ